MLIKYRKQVHVIKIKTIKVIFQVLTPKDQNYSSSVKYTHIKINLKHL